jgi:TFIIF-interacting CTD phosphatase-like protein
LTSSGISKTKEEKFEISRPAFMPQKAPFLAKRKVGDSQYCLVLDLDETLIHYVDNGPDSYFLVRPFCIEFLKELSQYYEIVVFTAGVQEYADWVIDQIDQDMRIKHRLYREHTIISPEERLKLMKKAENTGTI